MHPDNNQNRLFIKLLTDAEQLFADTYAKNPASLYPLLHHTAARIAPVDACYICLYHADEQSLAFVYTFDDGRVYEDPVTIALDDGPTSTVVRRNEPMLRNSTPREGNAGLAFGNTLKASQSALYVPMHAWDVEGHTRIVGAFSIQSYAPDAYDQWTLSVIQWLADRAGMLIQRERNHADWQTLIAEGNHLQEAMQQGFNRMLRHITDEAATLFKLLAEKNAVPNPADRALLEAAVYSFRRTCYRAQTEASQLSSKARSSNLSEVAINKAGVTTETLTDRELEILLMLRHGYPFKVIADELSVTTHTVKFHCKSIYRKLGVHNRMEAVRAIESDAT